MAHEQPRQPGRPKGSIETVPGEPHPVPPGRLTRETRRLVCDLADAGYGEAAIARHLGTTRWRVRTVLERNGKLRNARLIYLGQRP